MNYKLIIPIISLAVCVACYLDARRMRIELEKLGATRPLYVHPKVFGLSPRWMIASIAIVLALLSQL